MYQYRIIKENIGKNEVGENNVRIGAFFNDKLIGQCNVIFHKTFDNFKTSAYIDYLNVDTEHRKNGVGKNLIEKVTEELKKRKINYSQLFAENVENADETYKNLEEYNLRKRDKAYKNLWD